MSAKMIHCDDCGGSGRVDEIFCDTVDGGPISREVFCLTCAGDGEVIALCECCLAELEYGNTEMYCPECSIELSNK
jgi:hypothetical protein